MLASEALNMTNSNSYRADAIQHGIENLESEIKQAALKGHRECIVSFYSFPYGYRKFVEKYGEENEEKYREYNIEVELRKYFEENGFIFKRITGDICGGVRQAPYWVIQW